MGKQRISETWQELKTVAPETAGALGWFVGCIEWSPKHGHRITLHNAVGAQVAWGYFRVIPSLPDTITLMQNALKKRGLW